MKNQLLICIIAKFSDSFNEKARNGEREIRRLFLWIFSKKEKPPFFGGFLFL